MRTNLTIEQSAELVKRGVKADKASKRVTRQVADSRGREIEKLRLKRWKDCVPYEKASMTNLRVGLMRFEHKEIFTLADLLSLLPKIICHDNTLFTLDIHANSVGWQTLYFNPDADINIGWACAAELIDSLYETLCFIIDRNHVKLD